MISGRRGEVKRQSWNMRKGAEVGHAPDADGVPGSNTLGLVQCDKE